MSQKSDERLGTEKLGRLILSLALPGIAAQLINVLYNMVDRMYIGRIPKAGADALTGLGVCIPVIMIISAFAAFVGMGGAPLAAIRLGKGEKEKAEQILGSGIVMLLFFSVVLTVFFMIFKKTILFMFGASNETIVYGIDYLNIYLWGTVFVQFVLGLNTFISAQGRAKTAMLSVLIGAVLNIILDPLFIFVFNMGVKGAALATIISQSVSAVWIVSFLLSGKSVIRIKREYIKSDLKSIRQIMALGISPFVMQSTEGIINIVLNRGLQNYGGDIYVGSLTILQSIMQLIVVPIQGLTQGISPIMSYNYGAGNLKRVKGAFKIMLITVFSITVSASIIVFIFPETLASIFTNEYDLIKLSGQVMPIFFGGIWIFGIQMSCQTAFMSMGQAKISLFLALLRKIILLVPLALILPLFWGIPVYGIYFSEPIADTLAAIITGIVFIFYSKKLLFKKDTADVKS